MNGNRFKVDDKVYVAKDCNRCDGFPICHGCAFSQQHCAEITERPYCSGCLREDERDVIFVEEINND